jgi:hypothetical protein
MPPIALPHTNPRRKDKKACQGKSSRQMQRAVLSSFQVPSDSRPGCRRMPSLASRDPGGGCRHLRRDIRAADVGGCRLVNSRDFENPRHPPTSAGGCRRISRSRNDISAPRSRLASLGLRTRVVSRGARNDDGARPRRPWRLLQPRRSRSMAHKPLSHFPLGQAWTVMLGLPRISGIPGMLACPVGSCLDTPGIAGWACWLAMLGVLRRIQWKPSNCDSLRDWRFWRRCQILTDSRDFANMERLPQVRTREWIGSWRARSG